MKPDQELLVDCPHYCVNKLRVRVQFDNDGNVVDIKFLGHEQTHDEWTGRKLDETR